MTAVSPGGTPLVISETVYNQDLFTVDSITSAGTNQGTAAAVTRYGQGQAFTVTFGVGGGGIILPSSAEVGDLYEFYAPATGAGNYYVYPPSGHTIGNNGSNTGIQVTTEGAAFRYLGSSEWGAIFSK
jgi:hypothetical protein